MTIRQIIQRTDLMKPNPYPTVTKVLWLSELECMIQKQILLLPDADIVIYDAATSPDTEVLLGAPEVGLYTAYLVAMIDLFNGETERYNTSAAFFNRRFAQTMRRHASLTYDTREVAK